MSKGRLMKGIHLGLDAILTLSLADYLWAIGGLQLAVKVILAVYGIRFCKWAARRIADERPLTLKLEEIH